MIGLLAVWVQAWAGQPTVEVATDGSVVGRVVVEAPESAVRAAIPELQASGVNSNVLSVVQTRDGSCTAIQRSTRGLYRPLQLSTRFCPTAQGWREWLVSSEDFTAYEAEWTLVPTADGTTVQFRVKSGVNLMVPQSMLTSGTVSGVKETFEALLRKLTSR
jgi:hypothetical protein